MPHVTELCLFAAAFVAAVAYGPSLTGLVRKALRNALIATHRRTPPLQTRTCCGGPMAPAAPSD